jgi:hypothetical protein
VDKNRHLADSFSQFSPAGYENLTTVRFGDFKDVGDFYSKADLAINGSWANRFFFNFIARRTNLQIQKIRDLKV